MSDEESLYLSDGDELVPIIVDLGSFTLRAGWCREDQPAFETRAVVGQTQVHALNLISGGGGNDAAVIGDDAISRGLPLTYPVVDGRVTDMDALEKMLTYMYSDGLRAAPTDHPVLMNVAPRCHNHDKEDLTEVMFEKFSVPSLYLGANSSLAKISAGKITGLVIDCGYERCTATPVYQLHSIPHASRFTRLASKTIENHIEQALQNAAAGQSKTINPDYKAIQEIKQQRCKIFATKAQFDEKGNEDQPAIFVLGSNVKVDVVKDILRAGEAFFQPSLLGMKEKSLSKIAINAIEACDPELKWELLESIALVGGGSMIEGMSDRLYTELEEHFKPNEHGKQLIINADRYRAMATWLGGATISALHYFDDMVITKSEYEESGPYVARRKCAVI